MQLLPAASATTHLAIQDALSVSQPVSLSVSQSVSQSVNPDMLAVRNMGAHAFSAKRLI